MAVKSNPAPVPVKFGSAASRACAALSGELDGWYVTPPD